MTITDTIAGLAFLLSIANFVWLLRQGTAEARLNTRKALTDVVDELTKTNIAFNELELKHPRSVDWTIINLRRNYNSRRRYLANHGEFLADKNLELTSDIDCISLAYAFEVSGDYEKAKKFYELAVNKSPTNILKMWNLRGLARFWFVQGNAAQGRATYEESLKLPVPDTDSVRQTIADTYLLWSRIEDEFGYKSESDRVRTLGYQAASRIGNSQMREPMLKQFSGGTEVAAKSDPPSAPSA